MVVGKLIVEARERRDMTQETLASLAGVSRQGLSLIENGWRDPSVRTLLRITNALGLTVEARMRVGRKVQRVVLEVKTEA